MGASQDENSKLLGANDVDPNAPALDRKATMRKIAREKRIAKEVEMQKEKAEKKQLEKAMRQKLARTMVETLDSSENVAIPRYKFDEELKVFQELEMPNNKIFKAVGYNDQECIKKMQDLLNDPAVKLDPTKTLKISRKKTLKSAYSDEVE